jgi:alpha-N-arabinofuranosidase
VTLWDDDVYAKNTLEDQERVGLKTLESAALDDGTLTVVLSPVSWSAVALGS